MKTAEEILKKKNRRIISVGPDVTIYEALQVMVKNNIGAILIKEDDDEIIGIWTERDLMHNVAIEGFDPKTARIKDYMATELICASYNDSIYKLQDKFLGKHLRHLLIEKEGKYIGMLSAGDVSRASLIQKTEELNDLSAFCSWEYYENWKWKKGKSS